jgi:hypothetical protein
MSLQLVNSDDEFVPIEVIARRLHNDVGWVREKIRRRCANPMPVHNVGRHLLFVWSEVTQWVRNSPRPIHAKHRKKKKAA